MLILVAIGFFATAATFGLFMATRILTGHRPPLLVALMHGGAGATGLGLLTWAVLSTGSFGSPGLALSVLGCNALLGFYLFSRHLREKPWPKFAVVTHGFAAAIGFTLIVIFALTRNEQVTQEHTAFLEELNQPPVEAVVPQPVEPPPAEPPAEVPPAPEPQIAEAPKLEPAVAEEAPVDAGSDLHPPVRVVRDGDSPTAPKPMAEVAKGEAPPVPPAAAGANAQELSFPATFGHNQVQPSAVDEAALPEVSRWLAACQGVVKVIGHTSAVGSREGNYFVGLGRAMAIRSYLFEHQLAKRRIRVASVGGQAEGNLGNRSVTLVCE